MAMRMDPGAGSWLVSGGQPALRARRREVPEPNFSLPHLAGRCRPPLNSTAANNPANRRVTPQTVGVVHVVVPAETTKNRLAELPDKTMATVLPSTGVREHVTGNPGQSDRIIQFSER